MVDMLSNESPMEAEEEEAPAVALEENKVPDDKPAETAPVPKSLPEPTGKTEQVPRQEETKSSEPSDANPPPQTEKSIPIPRIQKDPDMEELQDAFPLMVIPKKRKNGSRNNRANKRKAAKIQIQFDGGSKDAESSTSLCREETTSVEDTIRRFEDELYGSFPKHDEEDPNLLHEFEDSLAFYSETHEDQDPVFIEFNRKKEKKSLEDELTRLEEEETTGKAEIERIVAAQLQEKQTSADRNIKSG